MNARPTFPVIPELSSLATPALVREIEARGGAGDDDMLRLAFMVGELRRRIESGDLGEGVKWMEWMLHHVRLSTSRLYELLAIADAKDPAAELERIRRLNKERHKEAREKANTEKKKVAKLEPERLDLIKWAHEASLADVKVIRERIITMAYQVQSAPEDALEAD